MSDTEKAAAILRQVNKDHRHVHTYRGGSQGCSCGQRDMAMIGSSAWIWGHVAEAGAAALSAAGFGLVAAPHMLAEAWQAGEEAGQDNADANRGFDIEHKRNPYEATR